jgi:DNA repair protein RecO (recombination protein O)
VLRTRALGEKDRVLVILTQEYGKLSASARGSRNPKSKLAPISQPFTLANFFLARGRSLQIVTQAVIEDAHINLAKDLVKTAWASYVCELSDALPEDLPDPDLFELLMVTLHALDNTQSNSHAEVIGRWFEAKYLAHLGYAPVLGKCTSCGTKITIPADDTETSIAFSPSLGGTLCRTCAAADTRKMYARVQALRALRHLENAPAPLEEIFERLELTQQARYDLRDVLLQSLNAHLSIKWKSRAFLDEILAG